MIPKTNKLLSQETNSNMLLQMTGRPRKRITWNPESKGSKTRNSKGPQSDGEGDPKTRPP